MPRSSAGAAAPTRRLCAALGVVVALVVAGLAAVTTLAAPSSAAVDDLCAGTGAPAGLTRFDWTGASTADPTAWDDDANWTATPLPSSGRTVPNYVDNAVQVDQGDTSTTGFVCIDPARDAVPGRETATLRLDGTVNVHVLSMDVADGATIEMTGNARIFVHGDPDTYLSRIRDGAAIDVAASTLGGRGDWLVEGEVRWRSLGPGLAATLDTDVCQITVRLDVCATSGGPGVLHLGSGGLLDVTGNDVNLKDGYRVQVEDGGRLRLLTGSIAADRDTAIGVAPDGTLDLAGDTNVFEGVPNGRAAGDLADLANEGRIVKSAGSGVSALNVDYSGAGEVRVESGTVSIADGTSAPVTVEPGLSVSTARCPRGPDGGVEVCAPAATAADPQQATLTVPADEPTVTDVVLTEDAVATDGALRPAVTVAVTAPVSRRVTRVRFEYYRDTTFPALDRVALFRGRAGGLPRPVPRCDDEGRIPRGVTACVIGRAEVGQNGAKRVVVSVLSTRPNGRWTVRRADDPPTTITRTAVPAAGGVFRDDGGRELDVAWTSENDASCGTPSGEADFTFDYVYRDRDADQRGLVWRPSDSGRSRGLAARVEDLSDVHRADVQLAMLGGRAQGVVVLERRRTVDDYWRGVAGFVASEAADGPEDVTWRQLEVTGLDLQWQRYVDDEPVGATYTGTSGEFFDDHENAGKVGGAPHDQIFVGLGCRGERFALDQLRLFRTEAPSLRYDLEAPKPRGDFVWRYPRLVGAQTGCGISFRDHPHRATRRISLAEPSDWEVVWSPRARSAASGMVVSRGSAPAGKSYVDVPVSQSGFVVLRLKGGPDRRVSSTRSYAVRAVPRIDLHEVTKRVPTGRRVVVEGRVRVDAKALPRGTRHRVTLHFTRASGGTLESTGRTIRTRPDGSFTLSAPAPRRPGRYVYGVHVAGVRLIDPAMSRTVLRTEVFRPKPAAPPAQTDQPSPSEVPLVQQPQVDLPPTVYPKLGTSRRAAPARCDYRFG